MNPRQCRECGAPISRDASTGRCWPCSPGHAVNRRADLVEDVEYLLSVGESHVAITARIGRSLAAIAKALYREGRPDLAGPFSSAYKREQTRTRKAAA